MIFFILNFINFIKSDTLQMPSALTIIVPIVISVVFIAVSFYLYTVFCHPQDSGIGTSLVAKIVLIFGQSLAWAQLLLVILDLSVADPQTMELLYSIVYAAIFLFTVFIMPFLASLYEADQQDSKFKQFAKAFIEAFIIAFVWSAVTFISFIWLSQYTDISGNQKRIPVFLYIFILQALIGWILLAINGAIGIVFFPYDLIIGFTKRPKKITKQEAYELKKQLQNRSDELIEQGQKLQVQQVEFKQKSSQLNFFSRRRRQGQIKDLISKFKADVNKLEEDYDSFDAELHMIQQSPVIPYLKLAGGILSLIITIVWIVQLVGSTIYINSKPAFNFLDDIFSTLDQGSASFVATILYGVLVLYMLACLIKGNVIFGLRIPYVIAFHPLQVNKTYLNSLLFNTTVMLLTSLSILQMSMITFPNYLDSSYMGSFFINEVKRLPIFGFLFADRIYTIAFLCLFGLSIVYLVIKVCRQKSQQTRRKSIHKDS